MLMSLVEWLHSEYSKCKNCIFLIFCWTFPFIWQKSLTQALRMINPSLFFFSVCFHFCLSFFHSGSINALQSKNRTYGLRGEKNPSTLVYLIRLDLETPDARFARPSFFLSSDTRSNRFSSSCDSVMTCMRNMSLLLWLKQCVAVGCEAVCSNV